MLKTTDMKTFFCEQVATKKNISKGKKILLSIFRTALFIGLIYVIVYPILYMISTTFRTDADILDPGVVWLPKHFTLINLQQAFTSMQYFKSLWNTVYIMMASALFEVVSTAIIGYGFARFQFHGKKILFGLVLFTIIVPAQTTIIPVFVNFSNFDFFGIISVSYTHLTLPTT